MEMPIRGYCRLVKIILLLLFSNHLWAQEYKSKRDTINEKNAILYILKVPGNSPVISENLIIDPAAVDSLYDLPYGKYSEFLKLLHVSTIWIVVPKKDFYFMNIIEILNAFKISKAMELLPIRIDNWVVKHPERVIAQAGEILNVTVHKENDGISFIEIVTRHPLLHPKKLSKSGIVIH